MPRTLYHPLVDELGEADVQRLTRIFDEFDWNVASLLAENNTAFIRFMRDEYSMNTRRMYCTKLSRVFNSTVFRNLYTSPVAHQDALLKWKTTRRSINAEEDRRKPAPTSWRIEDLLTEDANGCQNNTNTQLLVESSDINADVCALYERALDLVSQNNTPGAIRYLVQMYVQARKNSGPSSSN